MSGSVVVTPIKQFADEAITIEGLNQLARSTAQVGEKQIGLRELDDAALTTLIGSILGQRNLLRNGNFIESSWITAGGLSATAGVATENARHWHCRPAGGAVTYLRSTSVPSNGYSLHSARVTGDSSVTTVDVLQRVNRRYSATWKRNNTFSIWVFNGTGAAMIPKLRIDTCNADDVFSATTNRFSVNLQECANGSWTQVSTTLDMTSTTDVERGLEVILQFPSGSLDAGTKYVLVSQFKAEPGTDFTSIGPEYADWFEDAFIGLNHLPDNLITLAKLALPAYVETLLAVSDAISARGILELGDAATKNVGTIVGTVCAGDDSRFVRPYFQASMSGNQSISNATYTKANMDTVVFDSHSGYSVANKRYTSQKTGVYRVVYGSRLTGSTPTVFIWSIYKNGSAVGTAMTHTNPAAYEAKSVSKLIYLPVGEYIEAFSYIAAASGHLIEAGDYSYFEAEWIAP